MSPWRRLRRRRILAQPFPASWHEPLRAHTPHYERLSEADRLRLQQLVQLFVAEKRWEGLGGLALTDEIRVAIASQACLLLLGFTREPLRSGLYRTVQSILVYPSTVVPKRVGAPIFGPIRIVDPIVPVLGEAHRRGPVILTWDAVRRAGIHPESGHNVVYHEFAHALDMADGHSDGTPPLSSRAEYARWTEVCTREYEALRARIERGQPTFLDPYAGTSESEFFAVATEHFFGQPGALREGHRELYAVLRDFYHQDPAHAEQHGAPTPASRADGTRPGPGEHRAARRAAKWLSWTVGVAMLGAVIVAALHFSEERELARIAERAEPWWLAIAIVLQVATYFAQGETWRVVTRASGVEVPSWTAFKLSLAKLFVDQALPSGGISGTVIVARSLEQRGVARAVVMAAVVVDTVSYYVAYLLTLALALVIMVLEGHASVLIFAAALFFVAFSVALTATALAVSGRADAGPRWLRRVPLLKNALALLAEADPKLARNVPVILESGLFQLAIVLLDTATLWVLVRSLGEVASPTGVFASFVVSTLLRTIGIVPGGLGVFEAASVVTLRFAAVPLGVALAATLLYRGLSFWLPMVPGIVFSRDARKAE